MNERNVLGQVGRLGEDIIAALIGGDVVTDLPDEPHLCADVINTPAALAVEVKMCNGRHAQRPLPGQVASLFDQITAPFLFSHGVYAFVFYRGVHGSKGRVGKSQIWSRKFSKAARREIVARTLQYIYIVDVRLLHHLLTLPRFIREHAIVFIPEEKPMRDKVLYLNRTLLGGFRDRDRASRTLLDRSFGRKKWRVKTFSRRLRFNATRENTQIAIIRDTPIHVIGSRSTVKAVSKALCSSPSIVLGNSGHAEGQERAPRLAL